MNTSFFGQRAIIAVIAVIGTLVLASSFLNGRQMGQPSSKATKTLVRQHIFDVAGVVPSQDIPRFEKYMGYIMRESGVDIRFVFLPGIAGKTIETVATDLMDQLQIGARAGQERGLLLLYDIRGKRLKIEVGYGLEEWFPDAFINYLVEDHARMYFQSGDISLGLRFMLRLLQNRIREAVIGNAFDPRALAEVQSLSHLSGGAGVSTVVALGKGAASRDTKRIAGSIEFAPGRSPEETYHRYLDWSAHWPSDRNADLLTLASRQYLSAFQMSPAYAEFILLSEFGKRYKIVERNDLALLYFTNTPFVSPHFFVRQDGLWRVDIAAEVQNTRERVGGEFTWSYEGKNDKYTRAFADMLTSITGYRRINGGDNRPLVIRGRY